jgi:hypothetical protein
MTETRSRLVGTGPPLRDLRLVTSLTLPMLLRYEHPVLASLPGDASPRFDRVGHSGYGQHRLAGDDTLAGSREHLEP